MRDEDEETRPQETTKSGATVTGYALSAERQKESITTVTVHSHDSECMLGIQMNTLHSCLFRNENQTRTKQKQKRKVGRRGKHNNIFYGNTWLK